MANQPPSKPNLEVPRSESAESALLGAILLNNECLDQAAGIIKPDDFFYSPNRRIFTAMLEMFNAGEPIDILTLPEKLKHAGFLKECGGEAYVASLTDGVPRVSNIERYAKIIFEKSQLRSLAHFSDDWKRQALAIGTESGELIDSIDTGLNAVREGKMREESAPRTVRDIIDEHGDAINRLLSNKTMMGTPTGFPYLDAITAGWMPQDLVVIGARPSVGKTAYGVDLALYQALEGNPVLLFSLEMSRLSLVIRMATNLGRVNGHHLTMGTLEEHEVKQVSNALVKLSGLPIFISDPSRMYSFELVNRVRYFATKYKIRLVIVDYLQLLHAKSRGDHGVNRVQEIGEVVQDLKEGARILGKISGGTLIALAQLSRLAADEQPQLHHLRESGEIEQAADLVMFLWNSKEDSDVKDATIKRMKVAKQRNGPTGDLRFLFYGIHSRFVSIEKGVFDEDEKPAKKKSYYPKRRDGKQRSGGGGGDEN